MTVQELINELLTIEDKSKTVLILSEYGMGCFSECDDVSVSERDPDEDGECSVVIWGDESRNDSGE